MDEFDGDDEDDDDDDDDETQEFEISVDGIDEVGGPTWIGVPAVIREQLWDARKGSLPGCWWHRGRFVRLVGMYVIQKTVASFTLCVLWLKMVDREVT